jgi:hypothetical protein
LTGVDINIFLVWRSLLITSKTVVFLIFCYSLGSKTKGVYPVIKKWHLGVGMREAISPIRSLFIYPGYLSVVVDALMIVETMELVWAKVGLSSFNRSVAILVKALLSITTVASALRVSLFIASKQLYG